jgi:ATP dependent DNA ligase domain
VEEYNLRELLEARDSFWQYRIVMNPRFVLRGQWFPSSLTRKLRKFWDDFKAGKRPVLLLETPPQHGKSLSVIDFIASAVGHDRDLRVDGEAVIARDDGTPDFNALRSRRRGHEAVLFAFDLIEHDGDDLRDLPLIERKWRLAKLIGKAKRRAATRDRRTAVSKNSRQTSRAPAL